MLMIMIAILLLFRPLSIWEMVTVMDFFVLPLAEDQDEELPRGKTFTLTTLLPTTEGKVLSENKEPAATLSGVAAGSG